MKFDPGIFNPPYSAKCTFKGAFHSPEPVMAFPGRAIQADTYPFNTGICHLPGGFFSDEGAVWRHNHSKSFFGTVFCDIKDIRSQERLPAGEYYNGFPHLCDLIQKVKRRPGIKFAAEWAVFGGCAAVHTGKVAVARGFPGNQAQCGSFVFALGMSVFR